MHRNTRIATGWLWPVAGSSGSSLGYTASSPRPGYQGSIAAGHAYSDGFKLDVVKRPPHGEGFEIIPRHWVIERIFGWLGRNRRLAKDFERLIKTSTTMAVAAIIQLLVRRLANG